MDRGGNAAEQFIFVTVDKKVERLGVARNLAINEITGQLFIARDDEMKILEFRPDGRMKKTLVVQMLIVVRRNEAGENRHDIKKDQNRAADHRDAPAFQPPPKQLPRRKGEFRFGDGAWRGGFHFISGGCAGRSTRAGYRR